MSLRHFKDGDRATIRLQGQPTAACAGCMQLENSLSFVGAGLIQNYDNSTNDTIPDIYNRIFFWDPNTIWDFSSWIPQARINQRIVLIYKRAAYFGLELPQGIPCCRRMRQSYWRWCTQKVVVINIGTNDFYNSTVPPTVTKCPCGRRAPL